MEPILRYKILVVGFFIAKIDFHLFNPNKVIAILRYEKIIY